MTSAPHWKWVHQTTQVIYFVLFSGKRLTNYGIVGAYVWFKYLAKKSRVSLLLLQVFLAEIHVFLAEIPVCRIEGSPAFQYHWSLSRSNNRAFYEFMIYRNVQLHGDSRQKKTITKTTNNMSGNQRNIFLSWRWTWISSLKMVQFIWNSSITLNMD